MPDPVVADAPERPSRFPPLWGTSKKALICFSGGMDSTLLIWEWLIYQEKHQTEEKAELRLLVVKCDQINDKGQGEARVGFLKLIKKRFKSVARIEVKTIKINGQSLIQEIPDQYDHRTYGLGQQALWVHLAFQAASTGQDIYFGHLLGEKALAKWHLLTQHTFWCHDPKPDARRRHGYRPCGQCHSCVTYKKNK